MTAPAGPRRPARAASSATSRWSRLSSARGRPRRRHHPRRPRSTSCGWGCRCRLDRHPRGRARDGGHRDDVTPWPPTPPPARGRRRRGAPAADHRPRGRARRPPPPGRLPSHAAVWTSAVRGGCRCAFGAVRDGRPAGGADERHADLAAPDHAWAGGGRVGSAGAATATLPRPLALPATGGGKGGRFTCWTVPRSGAGGAVRRARLAVTPPGRWRPTAATGTGHRRLCSRGLPPSIGGVDGPARRSWPSPGLRCLHRRGRLPLRASREVPGG